eukprot:scaffold1536_cov397-Prasinococcus_capsulatus_cf.AAC.7
MARQDILNIVRSEARPILAERATEQLDLLTMGRRTSRRHRSEQRLTRHSGRVSVAVHPLRATQSPAYTREQRRALTLPSSKTLLSKVASVSAVASPLASTGRKATSRAEQTRASILADKRSVA